MKVLIKTNYGGVDWHDSRTVDNYLKQEGTYNISDSDLIIAQDAYKMATEMVTTTKNPDGTIASKKELKDIPCSNVFLETVKTKGTLTLRGGEEVEFETSDGMLQKDSDLEFYLDATGENVKVCESYLFGQVTYHTTYIEQEIPDDKVGYIAVENFLAPYKGVDCIQRFYHEPYTSLEEAQQALEDMRLHTREESKCCGESVKELHIVNVDTIKEQNWYKINISEIGKPFSLDPFNPWIKILKEKEKLEKDLEAMEPIISEEPVVIS